MAYSSSYTERVLKNKKKKQNNTTTTNSNNTSKYSSAYTEQVLSGEYKNVLKQAREKRANKKEEKKTWFSSGAFGDDKGNWFTDTVSTVGGTIADVGLGVVKGIGNLGEGLGDAVSYGVAGVSDLLGADEYADAVRKQASKSVINEILAPTEEWIDNYSVLGEKSDDVTSGLGYIAGIIATGGLGASAGLGAVGTTALTTGVTGVSGFGSGTSEAYQGGATDGEAHLYGLISGVSEAGTELIFGGLGKSIKAVGLSTGLSSADDMLAKKISNKISSQLGKNLAEYTIKSGAEGLEEVAAGIIQGIGKKVTYMSEEDLGKIMADEDLLDQFIIGAVTSGVAQAPGLVKSTKAGRDFITNYTQDEQKLIDDEVNNRVSALEEQGNTVNSKEKNKIIEEVQQELEQGILQQQNNPIAPISEQISQPTTQQVESNLTTEVESNTQEIPKELKTYYHGTRGDFEVFDNSKIGQNYDNDWSSLGKGFYFTDNYESAKEYGASSINDGKVNVKEATLDIKKPFYVDEFTKNDSKVLEEIKTKYNLNDNDLANGYKLIDALKRNGYDSTEVLKEYGYDGIMAEDEVMVFDASQVHLKSKDNNYTKTNSPVDVVNNTPNIVKSANSDYNISNGEVELDGKRNDGMGTRTNVDTSNARKTTETISEGGNTTREYSPREWQEFERTATERRKTNLSENERKVSEDIKNNFNKEVVFFNDKNTKYKAGASTTNENVIYIQSDENVSNRTQTFEAYHEIIESDIYHNKESRKSYIDVAIDEIINDKGFQKTKESFINGQENLKNASDRLIAKDIIADRFAEQQTGIDKGYELNLSDETLDVIDYNLQAFTNDVKNKRNANPQEQQRKTPTQEELDNLEDIRKNKSGSEYASAYYDLQKKYGTGLYKGLNEYKSTGKAVDEIAPVQKEIKSLTKEVKNLTKELKEVKKIAQEGKSLTIAELEDFYKQTDAEFRMVEEDVKPPSIPEDTTPDYEYENDNEGSRSRVESPLIAEGRDMENVGSRKVKAYQYENPEVRPFFQEMARHMQYDLQNSTKGERIIIGDISQTGGGDFEYSGVKRHTTPDIADLLDNYNYTYAEINKGLEAIVKDHGAENIAVAKRIEFALDDRLRNGYTAVDGLKIPANQEYIELLNEKGWTDYYSSIPGNDIAPLETSLEQDNAFAPTTDSGVKTPANQSLAIEQAPIEEFDNGGPMIRVSPETESKLPDRTAFDKKVIESAKEVENELGYIPKNPTREDSYDYEDIFRKFTNKNVSETTKLDDTSIKKQTSKRKEMWLTWKSLVTNNKAVYDEIAKETGNNEIKYKADRLNTILGETADITTAQLDNNYNPVGKSLNDIFASAENQGLEVAGQDFLYHLSNINRHMREKGSATYSLQDSQQFVREFKNSYPELAKQLQSDIQTWNKNRRNNLVDAGLISEQTSQLFEELDADYVPFFAVDGYKPTYETVDEIKSIKPIKRAIGGSKEVLPIKEAMMKQITTDKMAIAQNDLYRELVKSYGEKANVGADVRQRATDLSESLYADTNGDKYLTAYINGEQQSIKISDYMFDNIKMVESIENNLRNVEDKLSVIFKPLQAFSSFVRNIHTNWSPSFIITNPMKDIQDAPFNSKDAAKFVKNYPSSYTDVNYAKHLNEYAKEFKKLTGQDIRNVSDSSNLNEKAQSLYNKFQDGSLWNKFVAGYGNVTMYGDNYNNIGESLGKQTQTKKGLSKMASKVSEVNEFMELSTRYAEFKSSIENGASISEAFYNAKEITTNFGRGGVISRFINKNGGTFFNASVQGFSKFVRNFSGENGAKGVVNSIGKALVLGIGPAILNHLFFGDDDEEYEALPDYIKDNYYLIKIDDGEFIRIPKGRALSVFGSFARRSLEALSGEEDAFEGYLKNAISQSGPSNFLESNAFAPLIQASQNKTWYGSDLVPSRLQDLPNEEQYDEGTDKFSIFFGQLTGLSPYKVNYVLDQYTGGIGDLVLPLITDEANSNGSFLAPLLDKFAVNSTMDNKYAGEFYDKMDELEKNANSQNATKEDELISKYMSNVSWEMSELYKEKREVQNDNSLTKSEKYEKVKVIQEQINEIAKNALETFETGIYGDSYSSIGDYQFYKTTDENGETTWRSVYDNEAEDLASMGMTTSELNEYFSLKEEFSSLDDTYYDSKDKLEKTYGKNSDEYDELTDQLYWEKKNKVIDKIMSSNLSSEQKAYLYNKEYSSEAIDTVTLSGIDFNYFLDYQKNDFKANYNSKGTAIPNSRKNKVISYVNDYDLSIAEKAILIKSTNTFKFNDYNNEIVDYVESLDIGYEDKVYILNQLDMEIDDNGYVSWK